MAAKAKAKQKARNLSEVQAFIGFYGVALVAQFINHFFTQMSVNDWYLLLNKSPLTPSGEVFALVWTGLYALMAWAAARVYLQVRSLDSRPIKWWFMQLTLGVIWSGIFFGNQLIYGALIYIGLVWMSVLVTVLCFKEIDRKAVQLMLPTLVWMTFATYLNLYIYQHNNADPYAAGAQLTSFTSTKAPVIKAANEPESSSQTVAEPTAVSDQDRGEERERSLWDKAGANKRQHGY